MCVQKLNFALWVVYFLERRFQNVNNIWPQIEHFPVANSPNYTIYLLQGVPNLEGYIYSKTMGDVTMIWYINCFALNWFDAILSKLLTYLDCGGWESRGLWQYLRVSTVWCWPVVRPAWERPHCCWWRAWHWPGTRPPSPRPGASTGRPSSGGYTPSAAASASPSTPSCSGCLSGRGLWS